MQPGLEITKRPVLCRAVVPGTGGNVGVGQAEHTNQPVRTDPEPDVRRRAAPGETLLAVVGELHWLRLICLRSSVCVLLTLSGCGPSRARSDRPHPQELAKIAADRADLIDV